MPWCVVLSKPGWRIPDDFDIATATDPRLRAVYTMAQTLTSAVSTCVNELDRLSGPARLTPQQVAVRFADMNSASLNIPDVTIFVFPGEGPSDSRIARRARRADIHRGVLGALMAVRAQLADRPGYEWPAVCIEVILASMAGSEMNDDWVPEGAWGGADLAELTQMAAMVA